VLDVAERKRISGRKAAYFGSYAWSGGASGEFARLAESLKWEVIESFTFHGGPTLDDLNAAEEFGAQFAAAL